MRLTPRQELEGGINVTPMIDVLLVLIIIFMLLVQLRYIFRLQVPSPASSEHAQRASQLILELRADGSYALNQQPVRLAVLEARLRGLFGDGRRKALFIRAAPQRKYHEVTRAMDVAKAAGVQVVAFMRPAPRQ